LIYQIAVCSRSTQAYVAKGLSVHALAQYLRGELMQAISLILVIISIGTILGPVGAVVIVYHADLNQLVIPPQIRDIMNGNSSIVPGVNHSGDGNSNGNLEMGGIMDPVFVSVQRDPTSHTFSAIFNVTNPFNHDLTLNIFSTDATLTEPNIPAGSVSLGSPVTVPADETVQLTITGSWSQAAQDYLTSNYSGATTIDLTLTNIVINVNGITIQTAGPIQVSAPMNLNW
jgi:hypothetical protein